MPSPRLLATLALSSLLAVPVSIPAYASDTTPAQATDLQTQLHDWLANLAGPSADLGTAPVQVTAEGDHFNLVIAAPAALAAAKIVPPNLSVSVKATPLEAGRWALDDLKYPSPLMIDLPASPAETPKPNARPNAKPAPKPLPQSITVSIDAQQFHGLLDPSFATSSTFDSTLTGLRVLGPNSDSVTTSLSSHTALEPAADGRIDVSGEGNSLKSTTTLKDIGDTPISYTIDSTHSTVRARSVSPTSLATLIRTLSTLVPTLKDTQNTLNPDQRTLARAAVMALRDLATSTEAHQSLQTIKIAAGPMTATVDKIGLGARFGTEDGKLKLQNEFSLEGIDSPMVPDGIYRDYLPRKIVLKPRISGVPAEGLTKLLLRAIDSDGTDKAELQEAAIALLAEGPLQVAIDELSIDLGHADLAAHGTVDIAAPDNIGGEAQVAMKGLDALIKRANTTPDLQQIAPVLIFLKGIGQQNGNTTLWNITYHDGKAMVNDTDLSAMLPNNQPSPRKKQ